MKILGLSLLLISFVACDPYGFGFKRNPAFVLDEALKAIGNLDTESFLEISGKEALCIYGNNTGINYLKDHITLNPENIKLRPTVLETEHYMVPKFVGYWSYYHERYQVEIQDKTNATVHLNAIIDCDYGTDQEKDSKLIKLNPKKYNKKECRLIKIKPNGFSALPITAKCETLRVAL
jgi:hypothetical protein